MGRSTPFQKRAEVIRQANADARIIQARARAAKPLVPIGGNFGSVVATPDGTTAWTHTFSASGTVEHSTFRATGSSGPVTASAHLNGEKVSERPVAAGDVSMGGTLTIKPGDTVALLLYGDKEETVENAGLIAFWRERP